MTTSGPGKRSTSFRRPLLANESLHRLRRESAAELAANELNLITQHWRVGFYVVAVLVAAWVWMLSFKLGFRPPEWLAVAVLMYIPGLLSVVFRVAFKEGFRDVGWRVGSGCFWLWAYLAPLVLAAVSFAVALLFGKVTLAPRLDEQKMLDALVFKLAWLLPDSSMAGLLGQRFLFVALVGIIPGFIFAFGEELGWRGYLLTRLLQTGWPFPLLLSGLIWGIWHLPFLLLTGYGHGPVSVAMFTALTILFGVFVGWLRLISGSVFVASMAHASFNGFVQSFFGVSFVGERSWFWTGDYGIFVLIPYGFLVAWLYLTKSIQAVRLSEARLTD